MLPKSRGWNAFRNGPWWVYDMPLHQVRVDNMKWIMQIKINIKHSYAQIYILTCKNINPAKHSARASKPNNNAVKADCSSSHSTHLKISLEHQFNSTEIKERQLIKLNDSENDIPAKAKLARRSWFFILNLQKSWTVPQFPRKTIAHNTH